VTTFLWGVYPYICATLFFAVPVIRMASRPFSWSTRASGMFGRRTLGLASLLFHWGILAVFLGHLAGLFGGVLGFEGAVGFFYWSALIGGLAVLLGSSIALVRRIVIPEVRALSQPDDYVVHLFLIPIVAIALYQVLVDRIFGIAFTASSWIASLARLSPQPELMASAGLLTQLHVVLALTLFAYFPFTKLVHVWTYPINYFVRPYQSMRTVRYRFQRRWEFALRSDKSWLLYGLGAVVAIFALAAGLLGQARVPGASLAPDAPTVSGQLMGQPLYVSQCARCHGVSGHGDGPGASSPTFGAPPRDFTAGQYRFISTTNGVASDDDLYRTIEGGLPSSGMPAFTQLTPEQIRSLVRVLNGLWRDRPSSGAPVVVPPRPSVDDLTLGATLYASNCATCHGAAGHGDGPLATSLPTRPANLAAGVFKAGARPEQIFLRAAAGIPPLMPAFRGSLSADSLWAVVAYVERGIAPHP